jgi:hypothetical protein
MVISISTASIKVPVTVEVEAESRSCCLSLTKRLAPSSNLKGLKA